jgi:hypothetical protein
MIRRSFAWSLSILITVTLLPTLSRSSLPAQQARRTLAQNPGPILERNIRAELSFLASDAMQGRGSGTNYERVAAEYIGSQFRQFGLEAGGDADSAGEKGYVQQVSLETVKFTAAPTFTVTSGSDNHKWEFGRDFLVSFLRSTKISAEVQVLDASATPTKGMIAVFKLPENAPQNQRQDAVRKAFAAGAAGAVVIESDANRKTREAGNVRLPSIAARSATDGSGDASFAVIGLRKEALETLLALPAGARAEFAGPTEKSNAGATWNAIGVLRGSDPSGEAIILSAHLDHLGVNESATSGDNIFNGADDDASGCVAVLELARVLAAGRTPRRTIYFVAFGSEERGGHGSRYFIANSPVPLEKIVANLNFEMLGRPDAKVAANTLWLTGFERSTLGPELARQGALLVQDPHPEQDFFQRSDNYTLALQGVIAHTVSSYGMHSDYHRPGDDVSKVDFVFMTRAFNSMVKPIQWLSNARFRPAWLPGQAPKR